MQVDEPLGPLQTDSTTGNAPTQEDEGDMDVGAPHLPPLQQPVLPFVHDVLGAHHWGAGHQLMDTDQAGEQQQEADEQQPQQQHDFGK